MPSNATFGRGPLTGLDAELAAMPLDGAMRGGIDLPSALHSPAQSQQSQSLTPPLAGTSPAPVNGAGSEQPNPLQGMGPFLELEPPQVFKALHQLVMRQEALAKNRLAIDTYWTHVKRGHGDFYRLNKIPDRDEWKCDRAPGVNAVRQSAVPNKLADLCSKAVETLMVDPPAPEPKAENDSEEAERAAEMAEEFLVQDGGEKGTRDARLFWQALDAVMSKSAAFLHYWVDHTGNGSVPLQIKAHPQAVDPANPLVDPNGTPTTDYVLRYVTPADEQGQGQQFTEDPSQADRQWLPKIRIDRWGREHWRTYPETADIADCTMAIGLLHCTLGEAKGRWPDTLGSLDDDELGKLCDWTPTRYLVLLPPAMRARWKLSNGDPADPKGSSNDERTMFYYVCYRRPTTDYPKGAAIFISGADEGTILDRTTLSADVPLPDGKGTDPRTRDLPVVQVQLLDDAIDNDPFGRPVCEKVGGANEAAQALASGYLDALDLNLHPASYTVVTSPVTGDDVSNSRATGEHINVLSAADYPHWEEPRQIPADLLAVMEFNYEQMDSAMSSSAPAQGADKQQEVSGVARNIAVQQTNVAMSRAQQKLMNAYERHWRIKCELAMSEFTVPQMIRYEGEDGAYKQEWWTGVDFARVTDVSVKAGTGTMMPPQQKVAYVAQLRDQQFMSADEAAAAAKPAYAKALGVAPDPAQQHIESQVGSWLKGPPSPEWIQQAQAYQQAQAVADQQNAAAQQQYQQAEAVKQAQFSARAPAQPGQPDVAAPVADAPPQPVPPMDANGQPMAPPWTPFAPLPCDDEPLIAAVRQARLRNMMNTRRFSAQPPEWQNVLVTEYNRMRQAVAASQAPPPMPKGVNVAVKAGAGDVAQAEQAATHPAQPAPPQNGQAQPKPPQPKAA